MTILISSSKTDKTGNSPLATIWKVGIRMHSWIFFLQIMGNSQVPHLLFVLSCDGLSCRIAGPLVQQQQATPLHFFTFSSPQASKQVEISPSCSPPKKWITEYRFHFSLFLKGKLWANLSHACLGQGPSHIRRNGSCTCFNVFLLSFVLRLLNWFLKFSWKYFDSCIVNSVSLWERVVLSVFPSC